jgi:hypothetical protein
LPRHHRAVNLIVVRRRVAEAVLVALALVTTLALSGPASASGSGIRGVVLDTTCWGPCRYPPDPQPYTGPGLTVTVRSLTTNKLVATLHPKDGRFRVEVRPGPYRVRARVGEDSPPSCWRGEAKDVRVVDGAFTGVRLHVHNACVV